MPALAEHVGGSEYAYPGERKGRIDVALSKPDEKHLVLTVGDEGVGLPPEFDVRKARGLGMRIVRAFAEQLGAELQVRARRPGCEFKLVAPIERGA